MDTAAYENTVRQMCEYVGLHDWREVAKTQHVMIGDMVAGLIYDSHADADHLHVYFELGPTYPDRSPDLYKRMLEANLDRRPWLPGHFGVHPDSGQGVYHLCLDIRSAPEGKWLADFLSSQADAACTRFNELNSF